MARPGTPARWAAGDAPGARARGHRQHGVAVVTARVTTSAARSPARCSLQTRRLGRGPVIADTREIRAIRAEVGQMSARMAKVAPVVQGIEVLLATRRAGRYRTCR